MAQRLNGMRSNKRGAARTKKALAPRYSDLSEAKRAELHELAQEVLGLMGTDNHSMVGDI